MGQVRLGVGQERTRLELYGFQYAVPEIALTRMGERSLQVDFSRGQILRLFLFRYLAVRWGFQSHAFRLSSRSRSSHIRSPTNQKESPQ